MHTYKYRHTFAMQPPFLPPHTRAHNTHVTPGIVPVLTEPIEQLAVLPFADTVPWLQMLEFAPLFITEHRFKQSLDDIIRPANNTYEQKHRLIMKLRSFLAWSPTNLKPFEMYMTTFYRALKTGKLVEGQDLVNNFCARPEYKVFTTL